MILFLGIILTILSGCMTTLTLSYCLTPKYPRKYTFPGYLVLLCIIIILRNTCSTALLPYMSLLSQFLLLAYLLICHSNHIFTILLSYVVIILFAIYPSECSALFILEYIQGEFSLERDTYGYLLITVWGCLLNSITHILYYVVWHRLTRHKNTFSRFTATLLFLLGILISFFIHNLLFNKNLNPGILLTSAILMIAVVIISIVLFLFAARQQEKDAAEAAYEELKRLHELESKNYIMLETRTEELARIRHDINNQFVTIHVLLNSGKIKEAEQFTEELLAHISD